MIRLLARRTWMRASAGMGGRVMSTNDKTTTSSGTTVRITTDEDGERYVMLSINEPADELHIVNAGRITHQGKGFKPTFADDWALSTETLRAIADLIDRSAS